MKAGIEIAGSPFVVEYDYKVTSRAIPASRDGPASPMEFDVTIVSLRPDLGKRDYTPDPVTVPPWLAVVIEENLRESYDVCDTIEAAEAIGDADDQYDRRHDR